MTLKTLLAAATAATLATAASAQVIVPEIVTWDGDGDTNLDQTEFQVGFLDALPLIGFDTELSSLMYAENWDAAIAAYNGDAPVDFSAHDYDGNDRLDAEEYAAAWFSAYDVNRDGRIDDAEMVALDADFAEGGYFQDL